MSSGGVRGNSASSVALRKRAVDQFNLFRQTTAPRRRSYPRDWHFLPEATVCAMALYTDYVSYLQDEYLIESGARQGKHLRGRTVQNLLGALLVLASDKFKATGTPSTLLFFTCHDEKASTEPANWLRQLRWNVWRTDFQRMVEDGEDLDQSVTPLFLEHIVACVRAYSRVGSAEVSTRLGPARNQQARSVAGQGRRASTLPAVHEPRPTLAGDQACLRDPDALGLRREGSRDFSLDLGRAQVQHPLHVHVYRCAPEQGEQAQEDRAARWGE